MMQGMGPAMGTEMMNKMTGGGDNSPMPMCKEMASMCEKIMASSSEEAGSSGGGCGSATSSDSGDTSEAQCSVDGDCPTES